MGCDGSALLTKRLRVSILAHGAQGRGPRRQLLAALVEGRLKLHGSFAGRRRYADGIDPAAALVDPFAARAHTHVERQPKTCERRGRSHGREGHIQQRRGRVTAR